MLAALPVEPAPLLAGYGAVFVFSVFAVAFIGIGLVAASIFRRSNPTPEKGISYECGEDPYGQAWIKFNIRFYVIGLIFIVFEVEAALLLPWAVVFRNYPEPLLALLEGLAFLFVLGAGLAYVWAKGDLDWIKPWDRHDNLEVLEWKREHQRRKEASRS